jgi:hypothetical protein
LPLADLLGGLRKLLDRRRIATDLRINLRQCHAKLLSQTSSIRAHLALWRQNVRRSAAGEDEASGLGFLGKQPDPASTAKEDHTYHVDSFTVHFLRVSARPGQFSHLPAIAAEGQNGSTGWYEGSDRF